ncbi:MAG: hypothetical protein HY329_28600 [Chloroflexi bacterium]|nr:hypothetical protein [Chloroflexota bacterium]
MTASSETWHSKAGSVLRTAGWVAAIVAEQALNASIAGLGLVRDVVRDRRSSLSR